jgi:hypothetical protein
VVFIARHGILSDSSSESLAASCRKSSGYRQCRRPGPKKGFLPNAKMEFIGLQRPRIVEITDPPGICLHSILHLKNYQTQDSVLFACSRAVFS